MSKKQSRKASLNPKYRDIYEALEWKVTVCDDGTVELEQYTPAGEDFLFTVDIKDFPQEVERYAEDFDIDDHITMWLKAKDNGVAGVPSARELVHDAEAIQEMLNTLAEALTADSKSTIGEIIAATRKEKQE